MRDWLWALAVGTLAVMAWRMRRQLQLQTAERWRERRIREELEAYAQLDASATLAIGSGADSMEAARALARGVCRTVAEMSAFTRVAMLLRDPEGRFVCVGSMGTDDLTVRALDAWGKKLVDEERSGRFSGADAAPRSRMGAKSFSISLGEWREFDHEIGTWVRSGRTERRRWRRGIVAPIRTGAHGGSSGARMAGAIVVCADGERLDGPESDGWAAWTELSGGLARAMGPIETLADRLAGAMANEALAERLLRTEKLAGLGQLAGGVAHALNNPLTAVLGFAELIAETSNEPRVRKDAGTILLEARKMSETVQRLVDFWRPAAAANEAVDVAAIVEGLASDCGATLQERGVRLQVAVADGEYTVRGSKNRLRQMLEHLLNNAAQAIATARPREEGEEHAIRVALSHDAQAVQVIVSDTGPGFREPGKVFDPFYTTRGPEQGAGLGLSICYGIVREHDGEISAFNLHPHGAAVVVELPVRTVVEEVSVLVREKETSKA
jgi:signal transduction histidine kinase